jgi:hypothetical protein
MGRRWIATGVAAGAALVLLAAAWVVDWLGPGASSPRRNERQITSQAPPPDIRRPDLRRASDNPLRDPINAGEFVYERLYEGRLWRLRSDSVTPQPQGVSDTVNPSLEVHLTPQRVLQIRADRGSFIAPDNQPRSGEFQDNVRLTLFETELPDRPRLADDSPDIALRMYLDQASFDQEIGQIESSSVVHLTGPSLDFLGRGLRLNYNQRRNRIDRLEVPEGRHLRIRLDEQADDQSEAADQVEPEPEAAVQSPVPDSVSTTPAPSAAPDDGEPRPRPRQRENRARHQAREIEATQFYRATFHDNVRIQTADSVIVADRMEVVFSLREETDASALGYRDGARDAAPTPPTPPQVFASLSAALATLIVAQAPDSTSPTERMITTSHPTMSPPSDQDLVVTWTGRLLVLPEEASPQDFANVADRLLVLHGSPVLVETQRGDRVSGDQIDYLLSAARVRVAGGEHRPLRVESPQMGTLTGTRLAIDQRAATGFIDGPGTLDAIQDDQPLHASWQDRLDLTFHRDPGAGPGVSGIRTAAFGGDVTVRHPQFDMSGRTLRLALSDPADDPQGKQAIQAFEGEGDVHVVARPQREQDALDIRAQRVEALMAETPDGGTAPRQLLAEGEVRAQRLGQTLWTDRLDVTLAHGEGGEVTLQRLEALRNVRVDLEEQQVTALAERLVTDLASTDVAAAEGEQPERAGEEIQLFGRDGDPARLVRDDGELTGDRIVLWTASQTAHVPGPGEFTFIRPGGGQGEREGEGAATLRVTWARSMQYDHHSGFARFQGDTVAVTSSPTDQTRLSCDDLRIEFEPQAVADAAGEGADAAADDPANDGNALARQVRSMQATGDSIFLAERFDLPVDDESRRLVSRFRLTGEAMMFTAASEQLSVPGPGTMLIEDYRGDGDANAADAGEGAASGGVALVGNGQTLFTWTGGLLMDAARNDLVIREDVRMIHRSLGRGSVVHLDSRRFTADLEESGGLSVWLSGDAPRPQLRTARADEAVRIREGGRTILADHAHYDGSRDMADIFADPGKQVTVTDDDEPVASLRAERLRWDLARNRFEAVRPTGGRVPLRR